MKSRILLIILALVILTAGTTRRAEAADNYIAPTKTTGPCPEWTLCNAQTGGTTCTSVADGTGDENVVRLGFSSAFTAFADTSTSNDAWTVKLYATSPESGFDATDRALINVSGDLTPTNPVYTWNGPLGDIHAVIGGAALTGATNVTVKIKGCKY